MLGRYQIVSEIGQGAMGIVYKAIDPIIDRTVAIKTINLNLSRQDLEEYEARFRQEIKAAGRLNHPNIVTLYDVGNTDKVAYMAMEFLEGQELKDMLASGNLLAVDRTVDIIVQVADGLSFAHGQGVVHRDIKPSNIMVLRNGVAKVTDFGIARLSNAAVRTTTGLVLGSPRYMSPEQATGAVIDARSDIFSLGVVLYEALTGVAPFDGGNLNTIMYAIINTAPAPPSTRNPAVPAMLDFIVAKALAKALDDRYQSIAEFRDDLREARRQLETTQPVPEGNANGGAAVAKPGAGQERSGAALNSFGADGRLEQAALTGDDAAMPLSLDPSFDSFDATLRLAAITDQTTEFRDYITTTQKMRAYRAPTEPPDRHAPSQSMRVPPIDPAPASTAAAPDATVTAGARAVMLAAIAILAFAAIGLAIALVRT